MAATKFMPLDRLLNEPFVDTATGKLTPHGQRMLRDFFQRCDLTLDPLTSQIKAGAIVQGVDQAIAALLANLTSSGMLATADDIAADGATYGRVKLTALTTGQVDVSKAGVINKTLDNVTDGSTRKAVSAIPVTVAQGGTNATTAAGARTNLSSAASGANSDITSITALSTPLSVAQGGTGSGTASGARTNLTAAASGANADITSLVGLGGNLKIVTGSGSPETVVTAPVGSLYLRTDGGAGTSLYVKESGSGNTGWAGK